MVKGPLSTCFLAFSGSYPTPGSGRIPEWVDPPGNLVRPAQSRAFVVQPHSASQDSAKGRSGGA